MVVNWVLKDCVRYNYFNANMDLMKKTVPLIPNKQ